LQTTDFPDDYIWGEGVYSQLRKRGDDLHYFHTVKKSVEAALIVEAIFLVEATY